MSKFSTLLQCSVQFILLHNQSALWYYFSNSLNWEHDAYHLLFILGLLCLFGIICGSINIWAMFVIFPWGIIIGMLMETALNMYNFCTIVDINSSNPRAQNICLLLCIFYFVIEVILLFRIILFTSFNLFLGSLILWWGSSATKQCSGAQGWLLVILGKSFWWFNARTQG